VNEGETLYAFFAFLHTGFILHTVINTSPHVNNQYVIISVSICARGLRVNNICEKFWMIYSRNPNQEPLLVRKLKLVELVQVKGIIECVTVFPCILFSNFSNEPDVHGHSA
jgi:hypothetical protein